MTCGASVRGGAVALLVFYALKQGSIRLGATASPKTSLPGAVKLA